MNTFFEYSNQLPLFFLAGFLGALIPTILGFGGGVILLIILSGFIPAKELVAVVSIVQLASLLSRLILFRQHIQFSICGKYLIGAVPGITLAAIFFYMINNTVLSIILIGFLIFSACKPQGIPIEKIPAGIPLFGALFSFISVFVGVTGPSVGSIIGQLVCDKKQYIGTVAACLFGQSIMRIVTYLGIGLALGQWLGVCVLMIASGFVGTFIGYRLINKINQKLLFNLVRLAMTAAALNLFLKIYP